MRPAVFYYDGECGFCRATVARLRRLDWRRRVQWTDFRTAGTLPADASWERLTAEACLDDGRHRYWGFDAFRELARRLPLLWPLWALFRLPGAGVVGHPAYRWVARHRYRISRGCLWNRAG